MEKEKKVLVQFLLTKSSINKLKEIAEKLDCGSRTEAVRRCIADAHKREFPDYIGVQRKRHAISPLERAVVKAKAKALGEEELKKERESHETKKMQQICLSLDEGTVIEDPATGRPACRYPTFAGVQGGLVEKSYITHPLALMSSDMKDYQYQTIVGQTGPEAKKALLALIKENGLKE